jgi:hypothetical protein
MKGNFMKRKRILLAFIAAAASMTFATAASAEDETRPEPVPVRSITSLEAGYATDGGSARGIAGNFKTVSFIGASDFYWGFTSMFGYFVSTKESLTENGVVLGFQRPIPGTDVGMDLSLGLLLFGGRIDDSDHWQADAPAVQPSLGFSVPFSSELGVKAFFAPVIRPYNLDTGEWEFSRSYLVCSLSLEYRSFVKVIPGKWSDRDK